jgi:cytochrome c-type biogenesis protein CcmH
MVSFWIAAACLLAGALLFVLPPLLKRGGEAADVSRRGVNLAVYQDQLRELEAELAAGGIDEEHYLQARREIEVRVLEDIPDDGRATGQRGRATRLTVALGVALPLFSLGLYLAIGNPAAILPAAVAPDTGHALSREQIEARVAAMQARLRNKPDDVEGWIMLARSLTFLGRYEEAVQAYRQLAARFSDQPDFLADFADTLAMAQGKRLAGEPEALARQALRADPRHVKALLLAASAAFERSDFAAAAGLWERVLAQAPPGSDMARSIANNIAEARQRGGLPAAPSPAAAAGGAAVSGRVSLAPALAARVAAGDTLFVYARAESGPPMPIAILRRPAGELPLDFRLDDSMAMQPERRLSDFPRVVVVARVSKSGSAAPAAGDLLGQSGPVAPGARVDVVIDRERN